MIADADYVFEISWEVCNKVGGIYTVVKSKSALMMEYYKNYFLVGPYFEKHARIYFQEQPAPQMLQDVLNEMKSIGVFCYYGKWIDAEGEPNCILLKFDDFVSHKNEIKAGLWEKFQIDSLNAGWDFDEPMIWSTAVGILIEKVQKKLQNQKIVAHAHEWLSAGAIFHLKKANSKVRTVFTTHATMLGRAISGSGVDLYDVLDKINPMESAYRYGVQDKFLTEKAAAHNASIFTTVSGITGIEAEKILGKKPDVLVLNGLDIEKFPTIEETSIKHITCKEKIKEFQTFYFFPHYHFELEHNLIFFIVGRFEFRNKGIDIFIKALGRVNDWLKKNDKTPRTITALFWIPYGVSGVKTQLLENKNYYQHIKNFVQWNSKEILKRITDDFVTRGDVSPNIFTKKFQEEAKKNIIMFKRSGNPPLCTHNIPEENTNEIIRAFRENGLLNREEDRVKAIFYPVYLDGNDSLINLPYYDAMAGCHLGIFPSYYEPWGYTPLEAAAMGVCSVTTDLAGFGRFIESKTKTKFPGIYVFKRYQQPEEEQLKDFTQILIDFTLLSHQERVQNKISAKSLAKCADWKILIENYIEAHNKALKK